MSEAPGWKSIWTYVVDVHGYLCVASEVSHVIKAEQRDKHKN